MKTIALTGAASAFAATVLTAAAPASAKDLDFSFAIAGPNGYVQIGAQGHGKYGYGKKGKRGYGYKRGHGYEYDGRGYGNPYGNLAKARAYGYCLYPDQIRQKLHYQGWRGFRVVRVGHAYAAVRSHRYGTPYRLRVDRCTGYVAKATPLYGLY